MIVALGLSGGPRFEMSGGEIKGNRLYGTELYGNETVGNVAVNMRGTASQARFEFSGTAYVYDNLNSDGEQRNVYLKNTEARDSAYLSLVDSMEDGAKVGVYANIMPDDANPIVDVAIGYGSYTATIEDSSYFVSDKSTDATVAYDEVAKKIVLTPVDLEVLDLDDQQIVDPKPTISGKGTPNSKVRVKLISESDPSVFIEDEIEVDEDGNWEFTPWEFTPEGKLQSGNYTLEATLIKEGITTTPVTMNITVVDKEDLQAKVDEINGENLQEEDYTEESWEEFERALTSAQAVLDNKEATQAEVDQALTNLEVARNNLQEVVPIAPGVTPGGITSQPVLWLKADMD
ncbi:FIVAR domain-containing protein [Bacillus sp. JCM 19034]|uniref:FIVAR domain-containing protein n=1 Tax=Bacillus sp. JCM 19034 TaxID=1481928 RepID=UPI0007806298|nr:FIVAR domain-containing protein [Bacillus sp. JCM 19034]